MSDDHHQKGINHTMLRKMMIPGTAIVGFMTAAACLLTGCATLEMQSEGPAVFACPYTTEPIEIDAIMEPAWQHAAVFDDFVVPGTHTPAESRTEARMMWDHNYLYVLFTAVDRDIWGYLDEHDALTCREDVLEVFVKPRPDGEGYANFEINALGTVYDAFAPRENTPMGQRWKRWNCQGLQVATAIQGSLNDYSDDDAYWILEVAIPFASLPPCNGRAPEVGDVWRVLLARYDYSVYLEKGLELSSAFPLPKANFHMPEEWGLIQFVRTDEPAD